MKRPTAQSKRITVPVDQAIDIIRERLKADTGIEMSYVQLFNFLIHFYLKHSNEPRTKWQTLTTKGKT
jgi:hypothetical protein